MKRTVGCLLSVCLVLVLLSGCRREPGQSGAEGTSAGPDSGQSGAPQTAVWDGSIAGSFAGGDGSEAPTRSGLKRPPSLPSLPGR